MSASLYHDTEAAIFSYLRFSILRISISSVFGGQYSTRLLVTPSSRCLTRYTVLHLRLDVGELYVNDRE